MADLDPNTAHLVRELTIQADDARILEPGTFYVVRDNAGAPHAIDRDTAEVRRANNIPPSRKTGTVNFVEHESFSRYVFDHVLAGRTTLWGDRKAGTITAVINDHAANSSGIVGLEPAWRDHRAVLTLAKTEAWNAWMGISGSQKNQETFAEFLEDRRLDVRVPDSAQLLEIVTSIIATKGMSMKSAIRLENGETKVSYDENVEASAGRSGDLVIPTEIELGLSPFEGMDPYRVTARFRYRVGNGSLSVGVTVDTPNDILRAAFADVAFAVEEATDLTVLYGSPG